VSDQIPTLADLCAAISDGVIASCVDENSMYQVNALELRRYVAKRDLEPTFARLLASLPDPGNYVSPTISIIGQ
jgi:hypothetical protein